VTETDEKMLRLIVKDALENGPHECEDAGVWGCEGPCCCDHATENVVDALRGIL
jgi:hypothetical protein